MKLSQQSQSVIESAIRKAIGKFACGCEQTIVTDIHIQPNQNSGLIHIVLFPVCICEPSCVWFIIHQKHPVTSAGSPAALWCLRRDIGKKRYYFDMDGILQTGTVIIDKKTYELDTDGSLKGYTPKKKSSKKKSSGKSATSDKSGTSTAKKSVALTFDDGPSS